MKTYTEDELKDLTYLELITIVGQWQLFYNCELDQLVPARARKDLLIDTILEFQESKGGA